MQPWALLHACARLGSGHGGLAALNVAGCLQPEAEGYVRAVIAECNASGMKAGEAFMTSWAGLAYVAASMAHEDKAAAQMGAHKHHRRARSLQPV